MSIVTDPTKQTDSITQSASFDSTESPVSHSQLNPLSHVILKRVVSETSSSTPVSATSPRFPTSSPIPISSPKAIPNSFTSNNNDQDGNKLKEKNCGSKVLSPVKEADPILSESLKKKMQAKQSSSLASSSSSRSFFSRFLLKPSGRPTAEDENDPAFEKREEGWKADVFGYVPNFPTPPKYIRVRAHKKQKRELNRMFLAQELMGEQRSSFDTMSGSSTKVDNQSHNGFQVAERAVWCAKFSMDGNYLVTAGEDKIVRVWQVLNSPEGREIFNNDDVSQNKYNDDNSSDDETFEAYKRKVYNHHRRAKKEAYAPVFKSKPIREYSGHESDVLDVSWSKNNFLLSSSMDKTVKLWHVDRADCLGTFTHSDFVTSIRFHPKDDRFFLSGSLDCKLRLWSIPDKKVAFIKDVPDLITAVGFTPDGDVSIAGCFGGQCLFYETDGLHFQTQMHVRSSRGKNAKGSKITGIEAFLLPAKMRYFSASYNENGVKLLISTNDSRIRIYNLYDRSMEAKFKGHENQHSQINATFSDDGMYIISGSEDDRTYIWRTIPEKKNDVTTYNKKKDIQEYEYFHSNRSIVTVAIFAPTSTKKVLVASQDPVYDLCDPPPVKLKPTSEEGEAGEGERGDQITVATRADSKRSSHPDGNIIVCADRNGSIKIFRQDCAFEQRRNLSESANSMQRKRLSSLGLSPTPSWRDSFSLPRGRSTNSSIRGVSPASRWPTSTNDCMTSYASTLSSERGRSRVISRNPSIDKLSDYLKQAQNPEEFHPSPPHGSVNSSNLPSRGDPGSINSTDVRALKRSPLSDVMVPDGVAESINSTLHYKQSSYGTNDNVISTPRDQSEDSDEDDDEVTCSNCSGTNFRAKRIKGRTRLVCLNCLTTAN